ncbi:myb-like protein X [Ylistrum balloti]|uniref:myb-like protein X n=1 Tax=Ylistrum balloti TaxID=509963 RepID=UPI002905CE3A|nr:myb-like protein X [Ylistrum balloti]
MKNEDDETEQATKTKRRKGSKKKEKKKKDDGKENEAKSGKDNENDEVFVAGGDDKNEIGLKKEQTTKSDDINDNGVEKRPSNEGVNTLPRATRSRSTSERRSFKNLFRKPKLQKQRSRSTGGIQDSTENDVTVAARLSGDNVSTPDRKPVGEFGLTDKLQSPADPRDKIKRMTVGEAKKVKSSSKPPESDLSTADKFKLKPTLEGIGKSESMESHSSSLPDLTNIEGSIPFSKTDEDKKVYRRSVSADMGRRKKDRVNHTQSNVNNDENAKSDKEVEIKSDSPDTSGGDASNVPLLKTVTNGVSIDERGDGLKSPNRTETPHSSVSNEQSPYSGQRNSNSDKTPSSSAHVDPIDAQQLEKNRKESFSNFLNLSQNLPLRSGSPGARLLKRSSEEEHDVKSETETVPLPEAEVRSQGKIAVPLLLGKSNVEQDDKSQKFTNSDVVKEDNEKATEKRWYPFSKQDIKSVPASQVSDNVTAWLSNSQDTIRKEKRGLRLNDTAAPADEKKEIESDLSNTVSRERGKNAYDQSKKLSRSTYKSPRRFSGRSLSKSKDKESKEKESKDMEKQEDETAVEKEYDKRKDSEKEQSTNDKEREKGNRKTSDTVSTPDIPNKNLKLLSESLRNTTVTNDLLGKLSKGNVAKPLLYTTGTQSEDIEKRRGTTPISRSVQTSLESLKFDKKDEPLMSKALKVNLRTAAEGIIKKASQLNVGSSEEKDVKDEKQATSASVNNKAKRKSSRNSSSDSDMAIDISEIEDYSVFKTPESTPALKRKKLPPLSEIQPLPVEVQKDCDTPDSAPRLSGILKNATEDPMVRADYEKEDDTDETASKPAKKLSLMGIISMKRRLSKHRKQSELAKNRQSKRSIRSPDKGDEKENKAKNVEKKSDKTEEPDVKVDTKVIIENETNISLSKLALLQETDIVDDVIDLSDDLPKKHIKFEPGDEPVASDEPLDDEPALPPNPRHLATRRESRMLEKRRKVISCCKQFIAFLFSHIGLCSLVVAYSILGGFIFQALEAPFEQQTRIRVKNERTTAVTQILQLALELEMNKRSRENFTKEINLLLESFQTEVWKATDMYGWNNKDEQSESELQWSFASSLLFAITVMTTIGYGHVAPKTDYGRIVTIGYAVLGIPLTLLCLTNIGDLMATGFRMLYAKVCCGVCCVLFSPTKRRLPDPEKGIEEDMVVQGEEKTPGETIHVPTSLCILVMTAYILLGTLLFSIWEGWDVITGTYFSFITLSTIGFGDVVPGTAMDQWANEQKLVLCAMYLVFGLSLIAMCFNLVQEDVKAKCRWLGAKIGII